MNELEMAWSRDEMEYRGQRLRRAIAVRRERRALRPRRRRPMDSAVS